MSLHCFGAKRYVVGDGASPGSFYGDLFKGVAELATSGVTAYEQSQKSDADTADAQKKLAAAIAADQAAAAAVATSLTSAQLAAQAPAGAAKSKAQQKADADAAAMQVALSAQDDAGNALPASMTAKRTAAAAAALKAATSALQSQPSSLYAQNLVKAWNKGAMKSSNAEIVKSGDGGGGGAGKKGDAGGSEGKSWLLRPVLGPVPGWGVVTGGLGLTGLAGYLAKRFFFR